MRPVSEDPLVQLQGHITARLIELNQMKADCSYDRGYNDGHLAAFQEVMFFLRLRNDVRSNGKLIIIGDDPEQVK